MINSGIKTYTVNVYSNGDKYWYLNGKLHREDGPAIEWASGTEHWYLNNNLHREDGPAVEYADGTKHWYINGKQLSEAQFNAHTLETELDAEREKVRVLTEALENLRDEQNGAPLCTRETEWKEAMDKADAALTATAQERSK